MGPIYRTVLQDKSPFWKVASSYPFSVTKINQLLSFFVVLVFAGLVLNTLHDHFELTKDWTLFPTGCLGITLLALVLLVWLGQTGATDRSVELRRRKTSISKYHDG